LLLFFISVIFELNLLASMFIIWFLCT
jgi:hypothetical protein